MTFASCTAIGKGHRGNVSAVMLYSRDRAFMIEIGFACSRRIPHVGNSHVIVLANLLPCCCKLLNRQHKARLLLTGVLHRGLFW